MSLLDNAFGISAQALAFRSQRSSVLAANIANAETPQYFARDYDFKDVLARAAEGYDTTLATSDDAIQVRGKLRSERSKQTAPDHDLLGFLGEIESRSKV